MRWGKVAAIAAGVVVAYLAISMVLGFLIEVAMIALVAAVVVLAVKVAFYRRQVSSDRRRSEVREPRYTGPLPRRDARDVEEEMARLKREMGH
jgi:membrane protein implicated in regulation of membrane protease activity